MKSNKDWRYLLILLSLEDGKSSHSYASTEDVNKIGIEWHEKDLFYSKPTEKYRYLITAVNMYHHNLPENMKHIKRDFELTKILK